MNQDDDDGEQIPTLRQRGRDNAHRLLQHTSLLERRLRKGAEPVDLLLLIQDIKFTVEELQTLLQSVEQATPSAQPARTADGRRNHAPARRRHVELGPLLTRCVAVARQRLHGNGAPVQFHISSDLPVLTTNPELAARLFSLLSEHALTTNGKRGEKCARSGPMRR